MRAEQLGFTLVEILVALAIVAIALGASITALGGAGAALHRVEEKRFAAWAAQNHLYGLRIRRAWPQRGVTNLEVELGGRRWRLDEKIFATSEPNMLRMDVTVRAMESDGNRRHGPVITVTGFLPNPELGIHE